MLCARQFYVLPDGVLVIAAARPQGDWGLFSLEEWERGQRCGYSVTPDGRVLHGERPTAWQIGDLRAITAAVPDWNASGWNASGWNAAAHRPR